MSMRVEMKTEIFSNELSCETIARLLTELSDTKNRRLTKHSRSDICWTIVSVIPDYSVEILSFYSNYSSFYLSLTPDPKIKDQIVFQMRPNFIFFESDKTLEINISMGTVQKLQRMANEFLGKYK